LSKYQNASLESCDNFGDMFGQEKADVMADNVGLQVNRARDTGL